jgi:hypothetical protein
MQLSPAGVQMHANRLLRLCPYCGAIAMAVTACASSQKPFDQMTAQEHLAAAARENELADQDFHKLRSDLRLDNITPPETLPSGLVYSGIYAETGGAIPYTYAPDYYDYYSADAYIAWPRISDPNEDTEDAASQHRENALRHERAAAALEGRPSPMPLPPPQPPLIPPERAPQVSQRGK